MAAGKENETVVERASERELVVTRSFNAPARIVFEAWSNPELFARWWTPKSSCVTILSREMDIRTGGSYRLTMSHPSVPQPLTFFGRYLEVIPGSRMVWTNEESDQGAVTTVTFEERGATTLVVLRELYPSKQAADEAIASGATGAFDEQFGQLEELLVTLGA